jgi:hypothetical protein
MPAGVRTMTGMRLLRRVRDDLSAGENLELYVTALLSLTLAALGVFDVAGGKVLAAATLATLALLAGSLLGSRRQIAAVAAQIRAAHSGEVSAVDFFSSDKPEIVERVRAARDIRIVGITLARTLRNLVDELERGALAGGVIKVALIDVTSTAPAEAARRSTIANRPEVYENRLRPSIDLLRGLVEKPGVNGRIEVRFLPLDPGRSNGIVYVDVYSHSSASGDAVFTLKPGRDGHWYEHFQAEFERVWDSGRPADAGDGFPAAR